MDPFIGEIRAFAFNYTPEGWLPCYGQKVDLRQYQALYALLGSTYGPTDGRTYFTLPNLCGKVPVHQGAVPGGSVLWTIGMSGGATSVTLTESTMAAHTHVMSGGAAPDSQVPAATVVPAAMTPPGGGKGLLIYADPPPVVTLASDSIGPTGATSVSPHENRQPFLVCNFCIAADGDFPSPAG